MGAEIKAAVNKTYKLLELDVDGVYRYMLLLKKKKYAAVTVEKKPNGQMVSTTELKGMVFQCVWNFKTILRRKNICLIAVFMCKIAFFKRAWPIIKVVSRP